MQLVLFNVIGTLMVAGRHRNFSTCNSVMIPRNGFLYKLRFSNE
jgi:hypothetical protein